VTDAAVLCTQGWAGDDAGPSPDGGYPFSLAPRLDLDDLDAAATSLRGVADGTVVVHRATEADALRRALVRADPAGSGRVARLPTRLSQSGARILGDLVRSVADRYGLAAALTAVDDLERLVTCLLVTPSVARLSSPAPSVSQHARSWLPGSVFTVRLTGRSAVVNGGPSLGAQRLTAVLSAPEVDAAVRAAVGSALEGRTVVDLGTLRPEPPGTNARAIEICCLDPAEAFAVGERAAQQGTPDCPWCAQPRLRSGTCPFCLWSPSAAVLERLTQ
jgi:hypothetical protein